MASKPIQAQDKDQIKPPMLNKRRKGAFKVIKLFSQCKYQSF